MKSIHNGNKNQLGSLEALHSQFSSHMQRRNHAENIKTHEVKRRADLYDQQNSLSPRGTTSNDLAMYSQLSTKNLAQVQKQQYHERILVSKQSLFQNRIMMTEDDENKYSLFNRKKHGPSTADHTKTATFQSKKVGAETTSASRASFIKIIKDQHQVWDQKNQNQLTFLEQGNKNSDHEVPYQDDQGLLKPNIAVSGKGEYRQKSLTGKKLSMIDLANIRVVVSERKKVEEDQSNVSHHKQAVDLRAHSSCSA